MAGRMLSPGFSTSAPIPSNIRERTVARTLPMSDSFAWGSVWEDPENTEDWPRELAGPEYWLALTSGDSRQKCPMCQGTGDIRIVPETR